MEIMRMALRLRMIELEIKGSILLASEGINATVAGPHHKLDLLINFLFEKAHINPPLKISYCENVPFKKILVKIKPFIVCEPDQSPRDLLKHKIPYISPEELHTKIQRNENFILLDTRNDYEYQEGHFKGSIHLGTHHFADFGKDLEKAPEEWKNMPIITFCTGGIRCEKASPLLAEKGFKNIYQLEGGILNYFERMGRGFFEGNCFVFDERISLDENLNPTATTFSPRPG